MIMEEFVCTLRINHERPSPGAVHDDTIVNTEGVYWETSNVPCSNLHWLSKSSVKGENLRARDLLADADLVPLFDNILLKWYLFTKLHFISIRI